MRVRKPHAPSFFGVGAAPGFGVFLAGVGDECFFCFPDLDGFGCCGEVQGSVDGQWWAVVHGVGAGEVGGDGGGVVPFCCVAVAGWGVIEEPVGFGDGVAGYRGGPEGGGVAEVVGEVCRGSCQVDCLAEDGDVEGLFGGGGVEVRGSAFEGVGEGLGFEGSRVDGQLAEVVQDPGCDVGQDVLGFGVVQARGSTDWDPVGPAGVGDGLGCLFPDHRCSFITARCCGRAAQGQAAGGDGVGGVGPAGGVLQCLVGGGCP